MALRAPIVVVNYHRIGKPRGQQRDPALFSATSDQFRAQVRTLATEHDVISLNDLLLALSQEVRLPKKPLLITFDDAYIDFAEVAWPLLKERKLPATLFVPTAFPGDPGQVFWWDRLYSALMAPGVRKLNTASGTFLLTDHEHRIAVYHVLANRMKTLPHAQAMVLVEEVCAQLGSSPAINEVLTWPALRILAQEGVSLASHTHTHAIMTRISREQAQEEVRRSREALARETGCDFPVLAYPNGDHNAVFDEVLRRAGVRLAFTTAGTDNFIGKTHPLAFGRINISRRTSGIAFPLQLTALGRTAYRLRQGHPHAAA